MPSSEANPDSRSFVGGVLAACVLTSVPGLTIILSNFGRTSPDLRAVLVELILGGIAAIFGSLQIKAQTRSSGKWIGLLPLALFAFTSLGLGFIFIAAMGRGSADTGPFLVLASAVWLGVVAFQLVLAAVVWALLARLVKRLDEDAASGIDPTVRMSKWLAIAAIVHVAIKGATAGPVVLGLVAGGVAISMSPRASRSLGALSVVAALITTVGIRVHYASIDAIARIPLCTDEGNPMANRESGVVSRDVRAMPNVAEALVSSNASTLSIIVLPMGGGPVSAALRTAIENDVVASGCVLDDRGTKPQVTIDDPKYVEIPVLARVHLAPDGDEDVARRAIATSVARMFDPERDSNLIHMEGGGGYMPITPEDAGVQRIEWRSGSESFDTRISHLEVGSVPVEGKLEIEFVAEPDASR